MTSRPTDRDVRLTVIGCGTAVPEAERICSGYCLQARGLRLLLDCGPGVVHQMAVLGLPWRDLTHLAITHFHTDHIGDLPMLFFALRHGMPPGRRQPLAVYGPTGTRALFSGLAAVFGEHILDPGFPVELVEVRAGEAVALADGVTLAAQPTPHTAASLAYRIRTEAGDVGYTGDTGYSEEVAEFMRGTRVLIAECSLPDEAAVPTHLTPGRLARMANHAEPALLVVTHVYPQVDREALPAALREAGHAGPVALAFDGLEVSVYLPVHS